MLSNKHNVLKSCARTYMLSERTATSTLVLRAEFNLTGKDEAKYYRGNEYYFIFHSLLMKKKTFSHLDLV